MKRLPTSEGGTAGRRRHTCPPWCHRCPDLDGRLVMPMCMGTVASGAVTSLNGCHCERPTRRRAIVVRPDGRWVRVTLPRSDDDQEVTRLLSRGAAARLAADLYRAARGGA